MKAQVTLNEWELLSAYLDGQVTVREREMLERRLDSNPELKRALESMRNTRSLLRNLPRKRVPRHFTLKREAVRQRSVWALPLSLGFSFASLASIALVVLTFVFQMLPAAAPAMQAMSESAALPSDMSVQDENTLPSMITWGTPTPERPPAFGMGGGDGEPSAPIGMTEGYAPTPEAQTFTAPFVEEAAPSATEKEAPTTVEAAPTATQREQQDAYLPTATQASAMPQAAVLATSQANPILGVRPDEERGLIQTPSPDQAGRITTDEAQQRPFLNLQPLFWVRTGLVLLAVVSTLAAIYFIRKTRV
jgi:hypothetical protein